MVVVEVKERKPANRERERKKKFAFNQNFFRFLSFILFVLSAFLSLPPPSLFYLSLSEGGRGAKAAGQLEGSPKAEEKEPRIQKLL